MSTHDAVLTYMQGMLIIKSKDGNDEHTYYGAPLQHSMISAMPTLLKKEVNISLRSGYDIEDLMASYYARIVYKSNKEKPTDNFIISLFTDPYMTDSALTAEIRMNIREVQYTANAFTAGLWVPLSTEEEISNA